MLTELSTGYVIRRNKDVHNWGTLVGFGNKFVGSVEMGRMCRMLPSCVDDDGWET